MKQVARLVVASVAGRVHVQHDDVVELEALDLADVGDLDAGPEGELLRAHAAQSGDLGAAQAFVGAVGLFGVAGQQRDGRARLAGGEIAQRLGDERDGGAGGGEAERPSRRARPP